MFYQGSKTAKAAIIGTIMPWTGPLSNIPDGWIICDGSAKSARDYPLLVQAIGDTYNSGTSNLGGSFPNYLGEFLVPDLTGRSLMDIEEEYFADVAAGGTGKTIDTDADARSIISPYIGDNVDNGIPTVFAGSNSLKTDVVFTLNDRIGYSGVITGNTIIDGEGEKTIYIGGRKLGTGHVRSHAHSGSYETISNTNEEKPGRGVIPYENVTTEWEFFSTDNVTDVFGADDTGLALRYYYRLISDEWSDYEGVSGYGTGLPGRTLARIRSERPPTNIRPKYVMWTPIQNLANFISPRLESQMVVNAGAYGSQLQVPLGYRNYYPDVPLEGNFGTLVSNPADNWDSEQLLAHTHDAFQVVYDQASLKPQASMVADANIPSTTVLDNATNVGALEIQMNTSQPTLTCVYIIRAY